MALAELGVNPLCLGCEVEVSGRQRARKVAGLPGPGRAVTLSL